MENEQNSDLEENQVDAPDLSKNLEQEKENIVNNLNPSKMFSELDVDDTISDLFYNSVKSFFDIGFKLANKLNLDFIEDSIKKAREDQARKE